MYIPKHFAEPSVEVMQNLIHDHPLATLVTLSPGGLDANHIPFVLSQSPAPFGTLQGHVSRANSVWKDVEQATESLAVFHGPNAYISPSWYATKKETGKVVPTWNYVVVHAHGFLRVIDDPAWLRTHLDALTAHNEAGLAQPWTVSDAPPDFIESRIGGIVGIEMVITRLFGKWKVSQNQPPQNQAGVAEGLQKSGQPDALAMAAMVEAGEKKSC